MKENNHTTQQNTFELLAPAGSLAIFKAVVAAGADAVYVGGSKFGARAYADNFSDEELLEALDYAHLYGRRVYLTVNTLLKNSEIEQVCAYLQPFYEHGLDAVLVQDFGVLTAIHERFPDLAYKYADDSHRCGGGPAFFRIRSDPYGHGTGTFPE